MKKDIPFHAVLIHEQGELIFESIDELKNWATSEQLFWSEFPSETLSPQASSYIKRIVDILNELVAHCDRYDSAVATGEGTLHSYLEICQSHLDSLVRKGKFILSSHPLMNYALELASDEGETIATYVLMSLSSPDQMPDDGRAAIGHAHRVAFTRGIVSGTLGAEKKAFEQEHQSNAAMHQQLVEASREFKKASGEMIETLRNNTSAQTEQFDKSLADAKTELSEISTTYDAKLSLQAPVTYWTNKSCTHKWTAVGFAVLFIFAAIGAVFLVHAEYENWIKPNLLDAKARAVKEDREPSFAETYLPFAILLASASFLVWPLTFLSRIMLSNVHLASDASERAVMANTYLSLLRNEEIKAEDRHLILNALFRPTTSGLVKDDGAPPNLVSLIKRAIGQ